MFVRAESGETKKARKGQEERRAEASKSRDVAEEAEARLGTGGMS